MTEDSLSPFVAERQAVKKGAITFEALTKSLAEPATPALPVVKVPLPAVITTAQKQALADLTDVFGSVVPEEVRALTNPEVGLLMEERLTLDEIEKMAKKRKADIRTTVLNHFDSDFEEDDEVPRDKEGHVLRPASAPSKIIGKEFRWEMRSNGGTLDAADLKSLEEDGLLSHEDYLAMTDQVREVNPTKVMALLKKNPDLVHTIAKAVAPVGKVGSLNIREVEPDGEQ